MCSGFPGHYTTISSLCIQHIRTYFRHHIVEEGVVLILMESIRINLAMEGSKKEEDDRNKGKDGRGRSRLSLPSSNSLPAPLSKLA